MPIINFPPIANDQEFPALILAADASSRMGRPKALLPLADQQGILLDRAIDLGRALSRDVRVICGTLAKQTSQPGDPDAENAQAGGETDRINPGRCGTLL
nr:nucleotidyltransferase family protein [Marinobacter sediminum]